MARWLQINLVRKTVVHIPLVHSKPRILPFAVDVTTVHEIVDRASSAVYENLTEITANPLQLAACTVSVIHVF